MEISGNKHFGRFIHPKTHKVAKNHTESTSGHDRHFFEEKKSVTFFDFRIIFHEKNKKFDFLHEKITFFSTIFSGAFFIHRL